MTYTDKELNDFDYEISLVWTRFTTQFRALADSKKASKVYLDFGTDVCTLDRYCLLRIYSMALDLTPHPGVDSKKIRLKCTRAEAKKIRKETGIKVFPYHFARKKTIYRSDVLEDIEKESALLAKIYDAFYKREENE